MSLDLSIIILSHNSKTDLERLLPSIGVSEGEFSYEVIVVDNGSTDGSAEWAEHDLSGRLNRASMKVIKNQNTGFAHGNNLGIKIAQGKYILILNPDTKLEPNTLKVMLEFMESRPDVGIAGCKIIKGDGKLDLACRRRFPKPLNSFKRLFLGDNTNYNYTDVDENVSMEVDSVVGAFMMVRREALNSISARPHPHPGPLPKGEGEGRGFDEQFFMYGEDLDLCWRVKEAVYKVWYYPATFITHYKGSSSAKKPFRALKWFHDAMWIFYRKHYSQKYPFILNYLVFLGIYFRLGLLTLINFFKARPVVSK